MVDYRSLLTIEGELWERYAAYCKGEDARLSNQAPRFFDAIEVQRNRVSSAQRKENTWYWLDKLPSELWKFGTKAARPDDGQARSIKCDPILISGNRLEEIGAACRSASATRFQFALAAIAKSLGCIMADQPMVILVVMDSRPAAWRQIVGMFVQAHPIVLRVDPANDMGMVLDQIRRAVLNGMRHLHVDSELMVDLRRTRPDSCHAADLSCVKVTHIQHGAEAVTRTQLDKLEIHQFGSAPNAADANGLMITIDEDADSLGIYMDITESVMSQADAELLETTLRGLLLS
jgi:Condensation domain